jgi:hypothetical protein
LGFKKGRKKTGGRVKGVSNRLTSDIREAIGLQVIRYFGQRQQIEFTNGTDTHYIDDECHIDVDLTFHNYSRMRLFKDLAKLVLPPAKEDITIQIDSNDTKQITDDHNTTSTIDPIKAKEPIQIHRGEDNATGS